MVQDWIASLTIFFLINCHIIAAMVIKGGSNSERVKRRTPFILPPNYAPFTIPDEFDPLLPFHPFEHAVGVGYEIDDGSANVIGGSLTFPIIDKANGLYREWDLEGAWSWGFENEALTVGETLNPTNILKLPINDIYHCLLDPDACLPADDPLEPEREVILVPVPVEQPVQDVAPTAAETVATTPPAVITTKKPAQPGPLIRVPPTTIFGTKNLG